MWQKSICLWQSFPVKWNPWTSFLPFARSAKTHCNFLGNPEWASVGTLSANASLGHSLFCWGKIDICKRILFEEGGEHKCRRLYFKSLHFDSFDTLWSVSCKTLFSFGTVMCTLAESVTIVVLLSKLALYVQHIQASHYGTCLTFTFLFIFLFSVFITSPLDFLIRCSFPKCKWIYNQHFYISNATIFDFCTSIERGKLLMWRWFTQQWLKYMERHNCFILLIFLSPVHFGMTAECFKI